MLLIIISCLSAFYVESEARSQPGPILDPICPSGWQKCSSSSQCAETDCCGLLQMDPLPSVRCCVPLQYRHAFQPQNLCLRKESNREYFPGPGSCPPLTPPRISNLNLGFGCPKEDYSEQCKSHEDCKGEGPGIQLCCAYANVPGCISGKKCTPAVQILQPNI
ncbi:uncharacterized protein LOC111626137 [Centruroides sculpturatus]|uniref:uncharacterized protein LOC111626137 n=1 Tax=Centruroides sculpturatus TaxID=218467 RepID=UPI000C6D268D|nr:uncharacterized protein LOC111626137 [Centruroides sculpturatus]